MRRDNRPAVRTVVLRAFDPESRVLRFHTDVRSSKFGEIAAEPNVALHFYDAIKKIQIRVDGDARLHLDDGTAACAWTSMRPFSRACYRVEPGPGTVIEVPTVVRSSSDMQDRKAGRDNFAAVCVSMERIEWLYLAARGHRRAQFEWNEGSLSATWLVP